MRDIAQRVGCGEGQGLSARVGRVLPWVGAGAVIAATLTATPAAQAPTPAAAARVAVEAAKSYTPPRTPWGHPDLQGTYTTTDENGVPCGFSGCLYTRPADRTDGDRPASRSGPPRSIGRRPRRRPDRRRRPVRRRRVTRRPVRGRRDRVVRAGPPRAAPRRPVPVPSVPGRRLRRAARDPGPGPAGDRRPRHPDGRARAARRTPCQ